MKTLITLSLLVSTQAFSQAMTAQGLKNLMTQKQAILEAVNVGLSKKIVHTAKLTVTGGECVYRKTTTQTILKIDGDKMLVFSKEKFQPAATSICSAAGVSSNEENVLFYETKPNLSTELSDLDAALTSIKSIVKAGEIVTIDMTVDVPSDEEGGEATKENLTVKTDLSKSLFRNTIQTTGVDFNTVGTDAPNQDPKSFDLKKVLFCENKAGDNSDCVEGDFSDLLN